MEKVFSVVIPVYENNEKTRNAESSLSQDQSDNSCMNRPLGSEFSCTNAKNSPTLQDNNDESPKEYDYLGVTEVSSSCKNSDRCGSYRDGDLKLGLDLSLWVSNGDKKPNVGHPNPPDSLGIMQSARTITTKKNQGNGICSDSRRANNALNGVKRSYNEAVGSNGVQRCRVGGMSIGITRNVGQPVQCSASAFSKKKQENPNYLPFYWNTCRQSAPFAISHSDMALANGLCHLRQDKGDRQLSSSESCFPVAGELSSTKNQIIGWPPIRAYRRNSIGSTQKSSRENHDNSLYVKVNMDGVPIGRKVDLNAHESYATLIQDLENMFQQSTEYQIGSWTPLGIENGVNSSTNPLRLLDPTADIVLTYEDKDGDCMLVGDIPWKMFVNTVKRLRIMKTSDTKALAQRCTMNPKAT